jgi:hypothetical protein
MWYKFSKIIVSASAQIQKFLSPLSVPEVIENASSNIQLELSYCYLVADNRDSVEVNLALNHLAQKLYNLKQRNVITTKVSKKSLEIKSAFDEVDFDDFEAIVEHIDYLDSQLKPKKDMVAVTDLEPTLTNGKIQIFNPKTYEESERVCVGTSWCIGDRSTGMFTKYRFDESSNFYIVQDANRSYPFRKVAIDVRPNEIQVTDEINDTGTKLMASLIVDGKNYGDSIDGYFKYLYEVSGGEIKREDFVPRPLTPAEIENNKKYSKQNKSLSWFMDLSYEDKEAYILRMHDLTFAQFMFMYERKNVFIELLNIISSNINLSSDIVAVIKKDPALNKNRIRNILLLNVIDGYSDEDFDEIVKYKVFTVLGKYVQTFIGNFPRIGIKYSENSPEINNYLKKFVSEKIFTSDFPFDLRFFELFTMQELESLSSTFSDNAKQKYNSITSFDSIIDAFAKQDMDMDLFEKLMIDKMDIREAISKVQESILSNEFQIEKPFFLTKEVLTSDFVKECLKKNLISMKVLSGIRNSSADEFSSYEYGIDIEFNERKNQTGTVVAAMSDDPFESYDFDIAFDLFAEALLSGSYRVSDLPSDVLKSSDEIGVEGVFAVIIDKVNSITQIPVNLLEDELFLGLLIKSKKFTIEFVRDTSEDQKNAIANNVNAFMYAQRDKAMILRSIANENLKTVLVKNFPGLYSDQISTKSKAKVPAELADPNAKLTRERAMQLLRLIPNNKYHNDEFDELLGEARPGVLGNVREVTVSEFTQMREELSRRLQGESIQDYLEEKYFMMNMDTDDSDLDSDDWDDF